MYKRGQIYILAVILLAIVIYGLSTVFNIIKQEEIKGDFETLAQNYGTECSENPTCGHDTFIEEQAC